ncbi:hypothetical protein DDQ41_07505 [Streptomyces spongiicola]|uniref:Uncharacterized protein n=1 Tax=Streptomyces spongiicola TaxID=1690221 RepID=A0ABM6V4E8_9ACTN|nr:hypothetical protein DDQ41_07505 [Streptomyces spongiicola]
MPASPAAPALAPPPRRTPPRGQRRAPRTTAARRAAATAPREPAFRARGGGTAGRSAPFTRTTPDARAAGIDPGRPATATARTPAGDAAAEMVRWATFGCAVVPAVLVAYGTSARGAIVIAVGLAAVTGACGALTRRSRRASPRPAGPRGRQGGSRRRRGRRARRTTRN